MTEFDYTIPIPPPPIVEDTPIFNLRKAISIAVSRFVADTGVRPAKIAISWTNSESGTNSLDTLDIAFDSFSDRREDVYFPSKDPVDSGPDVVYTKP